MGERQHKAWIKAGRIRAMELWGKIMGIVGDLHGFPMPVWWPAGVRPGFWVWSSIIFLRDPQVCILNLKRGNIMPCEVCSEMQKWACDRMRLKDVPLYGFVWNMCNYPKCHGRSSCSLFSNEHLVYRGIPMFTLLGLMFPNTSFFGHIAFQNDTFWHHQVHPPSN